VGYKFTPEGRGEFKEVLVYNEAHPGIVLPERENLLLILGLLKGDVFQTLRVIGPRSVRDKEYLDRVLVYLEEFEDKGWVELV